MAHEQAAAPGSVQDIIDSLSDEQCAALYAALKQKYERPEAEKADPAAPEEKVYDADTSL